MSIAAKLTITLVAVGAVVLLLSILALVPLERSIADARAFHLPAFLHVQGIEAHVNGASDRMRDYVSGDRGAIEDHRRMALRVEEEMVAFRAVARLNDPDNRHEAASFGAIVRDWRRLQEISARTAERVARAEAIPPDLAADFDNILGRLRQQMAALKAIEQAEIETTQVVAMAALASARRWMYAIGAIAFGSGLGLVIFVSRTIARPIRRLTHAAADVARGCSVEVEVKGGDELAVLGRAFNEMQSSVEAARDSLEEAVAARTGELEDANDSLRQLSLAVEHAMTGISLLDTDGRYVMVREGYADMLGYRTDELIGRHWTVTVVPDDHHLGQAAYQEMLRLGQTGAELRAVRKDGTVFNKELLLVKSVDERGVFDGHYCFMRDITQRKRDDAWLRLMMHELDHRVKNTLASVLSLSVQTAASAATPAEFAEKLNGRIMSLARTHEKLAEARWTGTVLEELILTALAAHRDRPEVIKLHGPLVHVSARASTPLCLALHELTTNAAKHGALSRPDGTIEIDWERQDAGDLVIRWRERGGPRLEGSPPSHLGTKLVRGLIDRELGGVVEFDFDPHGLRATLRLPPECLKDSTDPSSRTPFTNHPELEGAAR